MGQLPPELDPRGRRAAVQANAGYGAPSGGRRGRGARVTGRVLGGVLSLLLVVIAGYYWNTFRNFNNGIPRLTSAIPAPAAGTGDVDGSDQNILLVGNDDRTNMTKAEVRELKVGRDGGSMATDSMIILHIPADGSKATLISLPRDSWVNIPGFGYNRLNAAYVDGYNQGKGSHRKRETAGADLLIKTVQNLTGLTINHYVQVSLLGFYEIAQAIGGIPVNLCHSVDDTVAYNKAHGSDGGSGFKESKGHHVLDGVESLEFVRQRHNLPNGDLDRVKRQQYFLTAAFRQVASVGILSKLGALENAIKRNVLLDPGLNLIDLANQMQALSADNISGKTIPTTPATIDGNSVLQVSPSKIKAFVKDVINPPDKTGGKKHHHKKSGTKSPDSHCIN